MKQSRKDRRADLSKKYKYSLDGIITGIDNNTIGNLGLIYNIRKILNYTIIDLFNERGFSIILDENNHGIIINKKIIDIKRSFRSIKIYTNNCVNILDNKIEYTYYTYNINDNLGIKMISCKIQRILQKAREINAKHWQLFLICINIIRGNGISIEIPEYTLSEALLIYQADQLRLI